MFSSMNTENALSTLLALFQTTLADVRFGDIDATSFTRAAAEVEAAADVVAKAQAALDDARRELAAREEFLTGYATRALAYARVYAETEPTLRAQVDAIALPRLHRRAKSAVAAPAHAADDVSPQATKVVRRGARKREASISERNQGFEGSA